MPAISVIIPAYNAARTVGATVDSVLAQTFTDFELIVVDDGSTDETADVVATRSDARLDLVRTENRGVSAARNRGLARATGAYVAFLDADDAWDPAKLERQLGALTQTPKAGLCFTSAQIVDDRGRPTGVDMAVECADFTSALLLEGNIVAGGGSSVLARTQLVRDAGGFDPALSQCADWDMWLRLSLQTKFVPIREALTLYRRALGSMSSNSALLERDTFAMLDKFYRREESARYAGVRKRAYANQWMVCAGTHLHAGHLRDSVRCVRAALRSDPRTARRIAALPRRWVKRARARLR